MESNLLNKFNKFEEKFEVLNFTESIYSSGEDSEVELTISGSGFRKLISTALVDPIVVASSLQFSESQSDECVVVKYPLGPYPIDQLYEILSTIENSLEGHHVLFLPNKFDIYTLQKEGLIKIRDQLTELIDCLSFDNLMEKYDEKIV